ncbi:HD domain-containing protein [Flavilitoribacter nigricans]|uniref:HD domain-containing protein n=1 Tax=Flavilitoribacter nigricans (strain ATCC 23147 / DSM 23189 / NBRC 102662 / NCIMB 1420 / SS-2) TaxID=1122177 RepID=A0A2D0NI55_FLAN2|nr:HD domain-containing protein [Flavilitoribacter nigricans]PHN08185.1 hypothetical protein CRP01_02365 [Flavilitoribacter nigricans DSM 23189 = NBRC 102662]
MNDIPIGFLAGRFVAQLLIDNLHKNLVFHNFHHTVYVVRGVRQISENLGLSEENKEILNLAAWFHDTGLTEVYLGHEEESKKIARRFLERNAYPEVRILQVLACIDATKMPQQPQNLLEKVICDADMFHLALPEYYHLQRLLLEEFRLVMHKKCTDEEWANENLAFLNKHHFWTPYGQNVLQRGKDLNIKLCETMLVE